VPDAIRCWETPYPMQIVGQTPLGIAVARNKGISKAKSDIILFVDSDCVLHANCLRSLALSVASHPTDMVFQLALDGTIRNLVGRMERLRLLATQECLLTPNGYIRYANTSGLAIKRSYVQRRKDFFNVGTIRGEDTFVLAQLCEDGILPRFLPKSRVAHQPSLKLPKYVLKHFWIGYHTTPARRRLRESGNVLMSHSQRKDALLTLWRYAKKQRRDIPAFLLILPAYVLESCGRGLFSLTGMGPGKDEVLGIQVDRMNSQEVQVLALSAAERRIFACVTYLTAWTLVQAQQNSEFRQLLREFDICYADGMGVVWTLWLMSMRRIKKVTANDFIFDLCRELAYRKLSIALVGGDRSVVEFVRTRMKAEIPDLDITVCSSGYFSHDEEISLVRRLAKTDPNVVFVGMGQPLQEQFVQRLKPVLPRTVFWCVGGLFDYIAGRNSTPPSFIRRYGMEWIWRLAGSPRRMWKRYIIGIPKLAGYILRAHAICLLSFVERRQVK